MGLRMQKKPTFLGLMDNYFSILTREFNHTNKVMIFSGIKNLLVALCILIVEFSWKKVFSSHSSLTNWMDVILWELYPAPPADIVCIVEKEIAISPSTIKTSRVVLVHRKV